MSNSIPHIVFVVGVHRSGTSAVTRAINLLGADLGGNLLDPQQGVNDLGFWESQDVVDLNEEILSTLGGSWYDFRLIDDDVFQKKFLQVYVERAKEVLEKNFLGKELAVIKDPRFCRLFPIWRQAVDELNWNRSVVLVTRNPLEVVDSLSKRDGFSKGVSALLWTTYTFDMLALTAEEKRLSIDYDFFMNQPHEALKKLKEYVSVFHISDKVVALVKDEINSGHRHHNYMLNQNDVDEVFGVMWELHELACEIYEEGIPEGFTHLFKSYKQYLRRTPALNDDLYDTIDILVKCQQKTTMIGKEHSYAQSIVSQRDEQLKNHQAKIDSLQDELKKQKVYINEQSSKLGLIRKKFLTTQDDITKEGIESAFMGNELLSESHRQIEMLDNELNNKKELIEKSYKRFNSLESKFNAVFQENVELKAEKTKNDQKLSMIKDENALLQLDNKELKVLSRSNKEKQYLFEDQVRQTLVSLAEANKSGLLKDALLQVKDKEISNKDIVIQSRVDEISLLNGEIKTLLDDYAELVRKYKIQENVLEDKNKSLSKLRQSFKEKEELMNLLEKKHAELKGKLLVKMFYRKS